MFAGQCEAQFVYVEWQYPPKIGNSKKEIKFFPSKTYIVDKFGHFGSHPQSN